MQSVMEMTDYFNDNSPKTTRPLVALYCGSRAGNKPIYLEKAIQLSNGPSGRHHDSTWW